MLDTAPSPAKAHCPIPKIPKSVAKKALPPINHAVIRGLIDLDLAQQG